MYRTRVRLQHGTNFGLGSSTWVPFVWVAPLLAMFTLGGLIFGAVFVRNVGAIASRTQPAVATVPESSAPADSAPAPEAAPSGLGDVIENLPSRIVESVNIDPPVLAVPEVAIDLPSALPEWSGTERINFLLLGIDRRGNEEVSGTRSDTIMVISVDPVDHSAVMMSFPRDLWVSIPGYGEQRINVAHAVGGPELAAATIEGNFNVHIDYWARIDFGGFEKIVDTLGGVMVDVERPIKDDEYPTEDYGYQRVYIGPGPQIMNGKTALIYARSRHSENDFGRAHRQQRVLMAMRERALSLGVIPKLPTLMSEIESTVAYDPDLGTSDILALARLASDLDASKVSSVVFDVRYSTPFIGEGGSNLLMPNNAAIWYVVSRVNAGLEPEAARVEVLNGSDVEGLALRTADVLAAGGYEVARVAPADRTDYPQTEIVVLGSRRGSALRLAQLLGLPESSVRSEAAQGSDVDIRLIVAGNFTPPGA